MIESFTALTRRSAFLWLAMLGLVACGGEAPERTAGRLGEVEAVASPAGEAAPAEEANGRSTREGTVEVLVEDHPTGALLRHLLHTERGPIELQFRGKAPELRSGSRIRVEGAESGGFLALDPSGASVTTLATAAASETFGEQRTLVMLVNFRDAPTQPWSIEQVRSAVFGQVSDFFLEGSFQQTWLAGDIAGWFTLPLDSTTCDQLGIASQARQAAASAGFDPAAYRRLVYLFPNTAACRWSGTGSVGGNPSQSWINGYLQLDVLGHELGHNLGLYHSHSWVCADGSIIGPDCTMLEYGDGLDIMGWSKAGHFNAFNKEQLGWLGGSQPPIRTVDASGTYVLDPYASPGTGAKALKILKATDPATGRKTWYYVEYRQAFGFDSILASSASMMDAGNVLNGVVVHTGSADESGNTGLLLDTTPETYDLYARDPALPVGRSLSDPAAGVTITTEWADGTGAGVRVALDQVQGQTVVPAPAPAVTVTADRASYTRNRTATLTATVKVGAVAAAGAPVTFVVTKADGAQVTRSATTDGAGVAVTTFRIGRKDPSGAYGVTAAATSGGVTGSGSTSFDVQ